LVTPALNEFSITLFYLIALEDHPNIIFVALLLILLLYHLFLNENIEEVIKST